MKTLVIFILLILGSNTCWGQDSITVVRQYSNDNAITVADSFFNKVANTIFISLWEGFEDSLCISVNNERILKQLFKTDESLGLAGNFQIQFESPSDVKILKLHFIKANFYIEERLNLAYKSLQIRKNKRWFLIYTNHFPVLE